MRTRPHRVSRLSKILAGLLVIALMGVLGLDLSGRLVPAVADAGWAGRPRAFFIHHDGSPLDVATEAPRRQLFTFNAWEAGLARQVKAANPSALVLVYKDLSSTRSYSGAFDGTNDAALLPAGIGYGWANANHPEWFLTGSAGGRLEWAWYPGHWFMDVGNAAYQEQWYQNVSAELAANGWDGVFMDNALTHADAYTEAPTRYPNDAAMQAATRSMLANVGPRLQAAGFVAIANISDARLFPGLWGDWLQFVNGALEEHFVNWNSTVGGPYVWDWGPDAWEAMVGEVATAEAMGKIALMRTGGNLADPEAARYGLASYLLAAGSRSMFNFGEKSWIPEQAWELGAPLGPLEDRGSGLHLRRFERGLVVVNAATGPVDVDLGGTYLDANGTPVTRVHLAGTRAAILRAAAPTTTAPSPTAAPTTAAPTTTAPPPTAAPTTAAPTTTATAAPTTTAPPPTAAPTTTTTATAPLAVAPTTTTTAKPTTSTTVRRTTTTVRRTTTTVRRTTTTAAPTTTTVAPTTTTSAPSYTWVDPIWVRWLTMTTTWTFRW
ncbi:MAG: hypothetical protein IPM45_12695 [Acidimicrobiales bacterium]|nr:hypothetical protein [Acidimicrobiales bacterium]